MKTFTISCYRTEIYLINVDAIDVEEAVEKAQDIDIVNWKHTSYYDDAEYQCEGEI